MLYIIKIREWADNSKSYTLFETNTESFSQEAKKTY